MASSKIKGIQIEIGGETTKLGQALEGVEKQSKSLATELKGVNTLLKMDPGNVDLLRQKQDLLTQSIAATENKLDTLKSTMAKIKSGEIEVTEEQFRDLQREIVSTQQRLERLQDQSKEFGSVFKQQLEAAGNKVKELGGKVEDAGKKLSGLSVGAAAGLGAAVTSAASLEGAVNKVVTATGMAKEDTEKFEKVLTAIHDNNYGEDYNDIAEKMSLVRQNLGDISYVDLQSITENAYLLEDAFGMDFSESIRGINGLMTNMGLTAEEAFNYMVVGAQNGLNKSDELGDNIAEYSQLWGQAGFSAEEMFTILQNGLNSGAYNLDKVNDLVKEMGISLTDGRIEENLSSFSSGTQTLFEKWKNGEATQADVTKSIINDLASMENEQEALTLAGTVWSALGEDNAMKIITSLNDVNTTYKDTTGAIDEANETMYGGTAAKAETALKSIKTAFAELGNAILPILAPIADKVTELAKKFGELSPTIQKIILVVLGLVTAAGPLVIFIGKIITSVGSIISVLGKLTPLFTLIKTAVSGLFTLIMANPVIAAIAAIIAIVVLLWNKCEWFRDGVKAIFDFIGKLFTGFIDFFKNNWQTILLFIINPFAGAFKLLYEKCEGFRNFINGLVEGIKNFFIGVGQWFAGIGQWLYDNVIVPIMNFFTPIVDFFVGLITSIFNFYKSVIEVVIGLAKGLWLIITTVFGIAAKWFNEKVITPIANFFKSLWDGISKAAQIAWNFIKGVWSAVAGWFNTTIIQPVANFFSSMWKKLTDGASSAWNGIKNVFSKVADFFGTIFGNAWTKVKNIFSTGGQIFTGITEGITKTFKTVVNGIIGGINKVVAVPFNAINGLLNKIRSVSVAGIEPFKGFIKYNPLSVPQIPQLATGDVAKPNNPYLAMLGDNKKENEVISPVSTMKDTMMDALTDFTNVKSQGNSEIKTLTNLMNKYMPEIVANMGYNIVLDDNTLVGKITPKIDNSLGNLTVKRKRGH